MAVAVSISGHWRSVSGTLAEVLGYLGDNSIPGNAVKGMVHDGTKFVCLVSL